MKKRQVFLYMAKTENAVATAPQTGNESIAVVPVSFGNPGKDGKYPKDKTSLQGLEIGNFSQFVGKLIADNNEKFQFPLFGAIVTVPAAGLTTDKALRYFKACKVAAALLFMGREADEILPPADKEGHAFLDGLKKSGIHFGVRSRSAVIRAIDVKIAAKTQVIGLHKDATNKMNTVTINATDTVKKARKIMKDEGIEKARLFLIEQKMPTVIEKY